MDHHQLIKLARDTAEAVNAATETFCRAVMLYEQTTSKTVTIASEIPHPELRRLAGRMQEISTQAGGGMDALRKSLPEGYDQQPAAPAPAPAPVVDSPNPGTVQHHDIGMSSPNLKEYMTKAGIDYAPNPDRELLRETLPASAQNPVPQSPYPGGPLTFEEIESKTKAPAEVGAPAPTTQKKVLAKENVWKHFLSGKVVDGGQGIVEPDFKGLKTFAADLNLVSSVQIVSQAWPTGFYAAKRESPDQFFLYNGSSFYLRVVISHRRPVQQLLLSKANPEGGWLPLDDLLMFEFVATSDIGKIYSEILNWAGSVK